MKENERIMDLNFLMKLCEEKQGAELDYHLRWDAARYRVGNKMFAAISTDKGLRITLKCDPILSDVLRQQYPQVAPGYFMNKKHWNTITVDGLIPEEELKKWIDISYSLVFNSLTKKMQKEISEVGLSGERKRRL
ncbi:MmcQ/YjbR family DNA-binding protein [Bacillota bacterium LX-D]|nr:MmcQ/YjbR family DNA-binding protein [Bacillota bacterium LX-D]